MASSSTKQPIRRWDDYDSSSSSSEDEHKKAVQTQKFSADAIPARSESDKRTQSLRPLPPKTEQRFPGGNLPEKPRENVIHRGDRDRNQDTSARHWKDMARQSQKFGLEQGKAPSSNKVDGSVWMAQRQMIQQQKVVEAQKMKHEQEQQHVESLRMKHKHQFDALKTILQVNQHERHVREDVSTVQSSVNSVQDEQLKGATPKTSSLLARLEQMSMMPESKNDSHHVQQPIKVEKILTKPKKETLATSTTDNLDKMKINIVHHHHHHVIQPKVVPSSLQQSLQTKSLDIQEEDASAPIDLNKNEKISKRRTGSASGRGNNKHDKGFTQPVSMTTMREPHGRKKIENDAHDAPVASKTSKPLQEVETYVIDLDDSCNDVVDSSRGEKSHTELPHGRRKNVVTKGELLPDGTVRLTKSSFAKAHNPKKDLDLKVERVEKVETVEGGRDMRVGNNKNVVEKGEERVGYHRTYRKKVKGEQQVSK